MTVVDQETNQRSAGKLLKTLKDRKGEKHGVRAALTLFLATHYINDELYLSVNEALNMKWLLSERQNSVACY